ncbi:hypothetical protein [Pseudomonas sp. Leaf48]|uniref:hypothetical protein n=1 Tax=Pseudomonas sp. Leaf48 TaxID=1736221 RepID=UPI000A7C3B01|nr:hypothetical protein [Pseudomonas sp. Leaf48]
MTNAYESWKAEQKREVPEGHTSERWSAIIDGTTIPEDLKESESLMEYIGRIQKAE